MKLIKTAMVVICVVIVLVASWHGLIAFLDSSF